jgi:hypothetical protein
MAFAGSSTTDVVLAAFDDHLRRVRGVCPEVRRTLLSDTLAGDGGGGQRHAGW